MQPPVFRNRSIHSLFHKQALIHRDKTTKYGHVWAQENPGYGLFHCERDPAEIYPVKRRPYSRSGTRNAGETGYWMLAKEWEVVPFRTFHVGEGCSPFVSDG